MKRKTQLAMIAVSLFAIFATGKAHAQIPPRLKATIPFQFVFKGKTLPAGFYYFEANPLIEDVLQIRDAQGRVVAYALTEKITSTTDQKVDEVVFHRVDNFYILSEVRPKAGEVGCEVPYTRPERRMMASATRPETVVIQAQPQ